VRANDSREFVKEHLGYQGGIDNPFTWEQVVEKFHWLSEACADAQLRGELIDAVDQLDTQPVSHLMGLLARVRPTPAYARTHRGIQ
jgi:2-methylcitrate dehydratase